MGGPLIQLLVLAGIAIFVAFHLSSILGTRDGFEPNPEDDVESKKSRRGFEVIEGGLDQDISDHFDLDSAEAKALMSMKAAEPEFTVEEFMSGARQAYEMILMAFENDDRDVLEQFLAEDVYEGFSAALDERADKGLIVEAEFIGLRDIKMAGVTFDEAAKFAEVTMSFTGELSSVVKDHDGKVVEGSKSEIKRQKDVWTFARTMGADDPNWELVATGG
ncbi:MAG: Tim44/TimA family putative adaptor protein [Pseudomonadota bacterium]